MNTQSLIFNHHTRVAIQIIIEDDTGALACSIRWVTTLFALLRQIGHIVSSSGSELSLLISDLKAALDFTGKILVIGINSMAYGLGVHL